MALLRRAHKLHDEQLDVLVRAAAWRCTCNALKFGLVYGCLMITAGCTRACSRQSRPADLQACTITKLSRLGFELVSLVWSDLTVASHEPSQTASYSKDKHVIAKCARLCLLQVEERCWVLPHHCRRARRHQTSHPLPHPPTRPRPAHTARLVDPATWCCMLTDRDHRSMAAFDAHKTVRQQSQQCTWQRGQLQVKPYCVLHTACRSCRLQPIGKYDCVSSSPARGESLLHVSGRSYNLINQ